MAYIEKKAQTKSDNMNLRLKSCICHDFTPIFENHAYICIIFLFSVLSIVRTVNQSRLFYPEYFIFLPKYA